eukprot:scaffold3687_cov240-Pinguiococcus_pyrenoidosus.AAC.7
MPSEELPSLPLLVHFTAFHLVACAARERLLAGTRPPERLASCSRVPLLTCTAETGPRLGERLSASVGRVDGFCGCWTAFWRPCHCSVLLKRLPRSLRSARDLSVCVRPSSTA